MHRQPQRQLAQIQGGSGTRMLASINSISTTIIIIIIIIIIISSSSSVVGDGGGGGGEGGVVSVSCQSTQDHSFTVCSSARGPPV